MRLLLCGDVHWSTHSSILNERGERYSKRLECLIDSIDWVENVAADRKVDKIIYLGDFFDKSSLTSEELSALAEVEWRKDIQHVFIVGNHEGSNADLSYNSATVMAGAGFKVISQASYDEDDGSVFYLPYVIESNRKSLAEYLDGRKPKLILSHNDLAGIDYCGFETKDGFSIDEITENCGLFVNGHLHNCGTYANKKIIDIGNITGQNFNEDGFRYKHHVMIIDTESLGFEYVDNPTAMNFHKGAYEELKPKFDKLSNAVLSISVKQADFDRAKAELEGMKDSGVVLAYRLHLEREIQNESAVANIAEKADYLGEFKKFVLNEIGSSDLVKEELSEVLK